MIGDIGADVLAASAAGAVGVLVPTAATLQNEVDDAELIATDLAAAVDLVLPGHAQDVLRDGANVARGAAA